MRYSLIIPGLLFTATSVASAQAPSCGCGADLDSLVAKIEANYIAYRLEVAGKPREDAYRSLVTRLRERAAGTPDDRCVFLLRELTDWFHDGHLFIVQFPSITPEERARLASSAETRPIDEAAFRSTLASKRRRDPIEGIWYTPGYRMAIMPDEHGSGDSFVGVVLRSDSAIWRTGQIKARFHRNSDGSYETIAYADDHSRRDATASIYRDVLLSIAPTLWGREFPVASHDSGTLDPIDPSKPTARLVGSDAIVISVPSHDPSYRPVLANLVTEHRADILSRPYLIVDLRGDLGGGSQTTEPIVPFLVSSKMRPAIGPAGLSYVVSSPDNIRYFRRGWNPDSVAERMTAAPGQVIPLMRSEELGMPFPNDTITDLPRRVAVLMDRGVASAGEAFVLQARRSTKVTLFGDNTHGMIDYQSVQLVRLACRSTGNVLGYPMIAASNTLPRDGLNATGIPPDVRVPRGTPDAVSWVLRQLRAGR